jgi:hypothetical protein
LDTSQLNQISFDNTNNTITVGAGLTFSQILNHLKKRNISSVPIHGQCLNVGVSGFSLHGGVHFGSLSEKYGLGSSNIIGIQLIIANGTLIDIYDVHSTNDYSELKCRINNKIVNKKYIITENTCTQLCTLNNDDAIHYIQNYIKIQILEE